MTTIGVAIAVPEPWGPELQDYRTALGDTTAEGIPTHITLAPPFEVDEEDLPAIEKHLSEAAASRPPFRIHLQVHLGQAAPSRREGAQKPPKGD